MIEGSIMEKKANGRSAQLQPKTQVSDCKKNSDTVSKPLLRQGKKREVSNSSIKNDVRRTAVQNQKSRFFDKRPRPRGYNNNSAVGGTEDTGLNECEEAEFGSVFVQGSKKQNLNHLLNFHVAPRRSGQWQTGPPTMRPRQNHHQALVHSNVHRHNKELFLQSNCQFVVKANGDYSVHLADPDIPVNWDMIEMIILHSPDGVLTCPICLCVSQAARVTRCGHAYCWACVLHYLTLADPPGPRPCPVCSQPIDAQHLKSVQSVPQQFTNVGEVMQMRLMRRLRDSTIVEPAPERNDLNRDRNRSPNKNVILSLSDATPYTQYTKLLTADKTEVLNIIQRERKELKFQLENEIDTTEVVYIEQALRSLDLREKIIGEGVENNRSEVIENVPPPVIIDKSRVAKHDNSIDWFDASGMDDVGPNSESSNGKQDMFSHSQESDLQEDEQDTEQLYEELENMDFDDEDNSKYYYFYQAIDGQLVFLSGINQRMMYCSWGSDESAGSAGLVRAPTAISGKVLHRLSGSVSTETRKKLRWLSHLPLHCPFDIVELELSPPAVTQEALHRFRDELEERALKREKLERAERRRAQRISRQQRKQLGYPMRAAPPPPLPDMDTSDAWVPLTPNQGMSAHDDQIPGPSPPQYKGPSFAKMASTSGVWTVRPQLSSPQPVTGAPDRVPSNFSDEDSDSAPVPSTYTMNLSDAITAALKNTVLTDSASSGKKKKKLKPKLLFSSGI